MCWTFRYVCFSIIVCFSLLIEFLIPSEDVAGVNLILNVVQAGVVTVSDDGLGEGLELCQVVHYPAAEKRSAILKGRFIDNHLGTLGLYALHYSLDGTLTEIVAVRLHRKTEHPDYALLLLRLIPEHIISVTVVAGFAQHPIRDKILSRRV